MKRFPTLLLLPVLLSACATAATGPVPDEEVPDPTPAETVTGGDAFIVAHVDLAALENDQVPVEVDPGEIEESEVLFRFPRVVQGTYSVSDFGGFVEDVQAWDHEGEPMPVEAVDVNTWRISNATELDRITYDVNDTFDVERSDQETPFSPAGTNIAPEIFVLNLHGFIGYFEGMTDRSYDVRVTSPVNLRRASALPLVASDTSRADGEFTDLYFAERYFQVTDNPMMYGEIDTEVFPVGEIEIVLSVYSPTGTHDAGGLEVDMARMMAAQRVYLGNLETTDRYGIFLFLAGDGADQPTGFGALEHHTSTITVLPEFLDDAQLTDAMVDVVSHEFFHIVTPLRVHSEDVHYFDYQNPTFSKHLWMYEGVTEYFASHFQVREGLESRPDFYEKMAGKIENAAAYPDTMSFTVMSEYIIEEPYESAFANVYEKGALIGMCLDVILHEESGGERSMMSLMRELAERYGVERPFNDDDLIEEITTMTYPEVGDFLETHVVGTTPIDYSGCIEPAGLRVVEDEAQTTLFFLDQQTPFIDADPATGEVFFRQIPLNSTLIAMGVEGGDVIETVNGVPYSLGNIQALLQQSVQEWTPETTIEVTVLRDGEEVELSSQLGVPTVMENRIEEIDDPSPAQLELRDAWLGG
ncbi:MAG: peptidase M61 [Gemmatimonadota bacterium]